MAKVVNIIQEIFTVTEPLNNTGQPIKYYINDNGCHICISHALDKDNYPRVHRNGIDKRMSRYIYAIVNDVEIPKDMCVMHTCDNPRCVNPDHLVLGTHKQNMEDRRNKGRDHLGHETAGRKFSDEEIHFIREISTDSTRELARKYSVQEGTIRNIRKYRSYKDVKPLSNEVTEVIAV